MVTFFLERLLLWITIFLIQSINGFELLESYVSQIDKNLLEYLESHLSWMNENVFAVTSVGISAMPTFVVAFFVVFEFQDKPVYLLKNKDYRRLNGNPPFTFYFVTSIVILLVQVLLFFSDLLFLLLPLDLLALVFCLWMGLNEMPFLNRDKKFLHSILKREFDKLGYLDPFNDLSQKPNQNASKTTSEDDLINGQNDVSAGAAEPSNQNKIKGKERKEALATYDEIHREICYIESKIGLRETMKFLEIDNEETKYRLADHLFRAQDSALEDFIEYSPAAKNGFSTIGLSELQNRIERTFDNLDEYINFLLSLNLQQISFQRLYQIIWRMNVLLEKENLAIVQSKFNRKIINKLFILGMKDPKAKKMLLYLALRSIFPGGDIRNDIEKTWFMRGIVAYEPYDMFIFGESFFAVGLLTSFYAFFCVNNHFYSENEKQQITSFLSKKNEYGKKWKSGLLSSLNFFLCERPIESLTSCLTLFNQFSKDGDSPFRLNYFLNVRYPRDFEEDDLVDLFMEIYFLANPRFFFNIQNLLSKLEENASDKLGILFAKVLKYRWLRKKNPGEIELKHGTGLLDFYEIDHIDVSEFTSEDRDLLEKFCQKFNAKTKLKNARKNIEIDSKWADKLFNLIRKRNSGIVRQIVRDDQLTKVEREFRRSYFVTISDQEDPARELELDIDLLIPIFASDLEKCVESMITNNKATEFVSDFKDIQKISSEKFFTNMKIFGADTGKRNAQKNIKMSDCEIFSDRFIWKKSTFFLKVSIDKERSPISDLTDEEVSRFIAANFQMESTGLYRYTDPSKTTYEDAMVTYAELQTIIKAHYKYISFGCHFEIYLKGGDEKTLFLIEPKKEDK